ncbi:MAG TPA: YbaK/EbsC family protein [Frankiaceae bacterium]|nr:YbaK/EbsC family protein [Frankiaceae bacterium]
MRGPLDLSRELLQAEVLHEIVHLPRRIDDAMELPDVLGMPHGACVTVRLYDAGARLVAALVPAGTIPATTAIAGASWARRLDPLTDPAKICALTDCHPYLVPPVGLARDTVVVADAALAESEIVFTPTGDGSTALKIRSDDLLSLTRAVVAPLVEPGAVTGDAARAAQPAWRDDRSPLHARP